MRRGHAGDLVARYTYSPGYIDSVAVQERDLNSDDDFSDEGEVADYHANWPICSVYALSDGSGAIVERYCYDAYGAGTVLDADGSVDADGVSDIGNPSPSLAAVWTLSRTSSSTATGTWPPASDAS